MTIPPFTLRIPEVSGEQAIVAAWTALRCSAWTLYPVMLIGAMSQTGGATPSRQKRLDMAHTAFTQVVDQLPVDDPFGAELLRYHDEVAIHLIKDEGDETPKWVN